MVIGREEVGFSGLGVGVAKIWTLGFGTMRGPEAVPESGRSLIHALITQSKFARQFLFANELMQRLANHQLTNSLNLIPTSFHLPTYLECQWISNYISLFSNFIFVDHIHKMLVLIDRKGTILNNYVILLCKYYYPKTTSGPRAY